MNKLFLILLIIVFAYKSQAQETRLKKEPLTETVKAYFHVLKADKQIKDSLYQAIFANSVAIASGLYTNNVRTGIWHFYNTMGKLIENYDYTKKRLLYEEPSTKLTAQTIIYKFDHQFSDTDHVTKPVKIGGRCFGYIPYLQLYQLPDSYDDVDMTRFTAILELLVSPGGRLADIKVHIKSRDYEQVTTFSTDLMADDDRIFIPATLNGEPIMCSIFLKCRITDKGELDINWGS